MFLLRQIGMRTLPRGELYLPFASCGKTFWHKTAKLSGKGHPLQFPLKDGDPKHFDNLHVQQLSTLWP
jgi:hypothetical protein